MRALGRPVLGVWIAGIVVVHGCALLRPRAPVVPTSAAALTEALADRRGAVSSLRARAHVRSGLARVWTREAVVVRRPSGVRIDVLSPFGLTLALGTEGSVLWAFRPGDATRYEGPASAANMARFLGTPIAIADLVDILLGVPPLRRTVGDPTLALTRDRQYRLDQVVEGGEQRLWFTPDTHVLTRVEELRDGTVALQAGFAAYQDGFPRQLELAVPGVGAAVTLVYDTVALNAPIDDVLFAPPAATRVLPLDATGEAH